MLSETHRAALCDAARTARESAYCPYSAFAVGAALLTQAGQVHSACNVENASYGLSLCAERAAVAAAAAAGLRPGGLLAAAVCGGGSTGAAITPCGACRQVLAEFAAPDCLVYCLAPGEAAEQARVYRLADLLPSAFRRA